MVGAVRNERVKAAGPYQRKVVHFQREATEIPIISTPIKQRALVLVPGAETHKLQKRKGVSAARRRSGGLDIPFVGDCTNEHYPKTPVRKTRAHARHPLATDLSVDKITSYAKSQDLPSSPFGKTMGKPDFSDFSDLPHLASLEKALHSSVPSSDLHLEHIRPDAPLEKNQCRCTDLESENKELRRRYGALNERYQTLFAMMKELRTKQEYGQSLHQAGSADEMLCDADDEFEHSRASSGLATLYADVPNGSVTPALALAPGFSTPSTSSSTSTTQLNTPADTPAMPLRIIDEDYDEGYDGRAARVQTVRLNVSRKLGLTPGMSTEETLDRLTASLSAQWRIVDDSSNPAPAPAPAAPRIVFPPLPMPPLPEFHM